MSKLQLKWTGGTTGQGDYAREDGSQRVNIAIPEGKGGSGEGFAPRELLASAAGACYSTTLLKILESRDFPVTDFSIDTEVTVGEEGYEITHLPKVTLSSEVTDKEYAGVERAFTSADRGCSIGNLLKDGGAKLTVEPEITVE